jgi:hypothetical protein
MAGYLVTAAEPGAVVAKAEAAVAPDAVVAAAVAPDAVVAEAVAPDAAAAEVAAPDVVVAEVVASPEVLVPAGPPLGVPFSLCRGRFVAPAL